MRRSTLLFLLLGSTSTLAAQQDSTRRAAKPDLQLEPTRTIDLDTDGPPYFGYHHTISDLFTGLSRANFRVDTILEPEPRREGRGSPHWREASRFVPRTLIMRARKEGS